jgi:hypothetical protein
MNCADPGGSGSQLQEKKDYSLGENSKKKV